MVYSCREADKRDGCGWLEIRGSWSRSSGGRVTLQHEKVKLKPTEQVDQLQLPHGTDPINRQTPEAKPGKGDMPATKRL
ncbi:hypothetical protein EYF80_068056 [Liparis tanakae]|uniref:Uncharacterized protein n=1 Tax=Liparis tanakae TaxID=230148 RepID=A0A4Z2E0B7_9TELE|nr:hypothetical protein EYF80_068056 [Liparis tanakae]